MTEDIYLTRANVRETTFNLPFTPRHPPYNHQTAHTALHSMSRAWGLFWEQGTGKTKTLIEDAVLLALDHQITGALVVAPNGVHYNWAREELPKHYPADGPPQCTFVWETQRAQTQAHKKAFETFMADPAALKWLLVSYDGMCTAQGKAASWVFIKAHWQRLLYIADESQRIKAPQTRGKNKVERTRVVTESGKFGSHRRIASGTPMDTPLDIYSQVRFLDPDFWARELGIASFAAFKAHFAVWADVYLPSQNRTFPKLVKYQRLDELAAILQRISTRVTKDDALDLPPKVYQPVYHPLAPAQRRAYDELKRDALTFLGSGELVTAAHAFTLLTRLTQITSGFVNVDGRPEPFDPNPRARLIQTLFEDNAKPILVWARFVQDTQTVMDATRAAGRSAVLYDGSDPARSLDLWHGGWVNTLVANLSSGLTEGVTLTEADTVIYYSNTPKLIARLQSEDRVHRIGQTRSVTYIDLLADDTHDQRLLDALRSKREITAQVLDDVIRGKPS